LVQILGGLIKISEHSRRSCSEQFGPR